MKLSGSLYLVPLLIIVLSGCNRYYTPVRSTQSIPEQIKTSLAKGRYFILRDSASSYGMDRVELNDNKGLVSFELVTLPKVHTRYTMASAPRNYFFKYDQPDSVVLREVHLFTKQRFPAEMNTRSDIPLSAIDKVEVIEFDRKKTRKQNLLVGLGVTAGIATIVAIIVSAETISDLTDWGNY